MLILINKEIVINATIATAIPRNIAPRVKAINISKALSGGMMQSIRCPITLLITNEEELLAKAFCIEAIIINPDATKTLKLEPIHTNTLKCKDGSVVYNKDVITFEHDKKLDIVYLDPPYNERQYSKNYFPLNMISLSPREQENQPPLRGKTGIPEDCFLSPFCKKGQVEEAFNTLFSNIKTDWLFMSYNSESIVSKERLIEIMKKYGEVSVIERDYKRFKSFEYNDDNEIKEYLFCLQCVAN